MSNTHLVICIDNSEYPASLEKRKIYETVEDVDAVKHGQIRVIDESGEDYLYPKECFVDANLPKDTTRPWLRLPNTGLQTDKGKLSCLLHAQNPRQLAIAAELGR